MRTVGFGLAAAAGWSAPALAPVVPRISDALRLARTLRAGSGGVALTFDDGPHPEGTPALLDLLGEAGARATFFLVGEQAERRPAIVERIVREGHLAALHGYRHRFQLRLDPVTLARDLDRGTAVVAETAGSRPWLYRPPYGAFSTAGLLLLRRRGLTPLLWSRWGHDWRRLRRPEQIVAEVTRDLGEDDVLLLHDADHYSGSGSWRNTLAAVPMVLETVGRLGLAAVVPEPTPQPAASL